ncbi:MAG TPA: acyl-ACP desaturase [Gemmataceae bacterium]|nr:acyl-ACP desaturase [Gemmataceae bacterium]
MAIPGNPDSPFLRHTIYQLYRDFFDQAERKRRWNVADDIPWDQVGSGVEPAIAHIIESFCAVEMFLPDYVGQILPHIRGSRGRAWFTANWGYEESKHSLAMGDWLLRSGHRSEEQMADLEDQVFTHVWELPLDSVRGMVCYSMTQELATWMHYRNMRALIGKDACPALYKLLTYIMVDERAHYDFFLRVVKLQLEEDRAETIEQLRRVLNHFQMPAVYALADGRQRVAEVKALRIFEDDIFYQHVYLPILDTLGISRQEMRNRTATRKSLSAQPLP